MEGEEKEKGKTEGVIDVGVPLHDHGTMPTLWAQVYSTAARPVPCNILCNVFLTL